MAGACGTSQAAHASEDQLPAPGAFAFPSDMLGEPQSRTSGTYVRLWDLHRMVKSQGELRRGIGHLDDGIEQARDVASPNEVREALEALSEGEWAKLYLAAKLCIDNTPFESSKDLVNEMVTRAMTAQPDGHGGGWPKNKGVAFIAYALITLRHLASDSRKTFNYKNRIDLSALGKNFEVDGRLPTKGNPVVSVQSIEEDLILIEEELEHGKHAESAAKAAARIEAHFAGDSDVLMLIYLLKECDSNKQAKEISGWEEKHYQAVRKRLRRSIQALFPMRQVS
jgi:hypothetical protein